MWMSLAPFLIAFKRTMLQSLTTGASSLAFSSSRRFHVLGASPVNSISPSSKPAMTSSYEGPAL